MPNYQGKLYLTSVKLSVSEGAALAGMNPCTTFESKTSSRMMQNFKLVADVVQGFSPVVPMARQSEKD
jgi:hypothetical protein